MPEFPPPPPPRTDVPRPTNFTEDSWSEYLDYMSEVVAEHGTVPAWIGTDGTLYMRYIPAEMAPALGGPVDSHVSITPDSPMYAKYARTVPIIYNYQGVEVPDATGPDHDAEAG